MLLAVSKDQKYRVIVSSAYFRNLVVHQGQQQIKSKRLNTFCNIQCQSTS
jgi:hypothetical protein